MNKYSCDSTFKLKEDYFVIHKYFYSGKPFKIVDSYSAFKHQPVVSRNLKLTHLKTPLTNPSFNFYHFVWNVYNFWTNQFD